MQKLDKGSSEPRAWPGLTCMSSWDYNTSFSKYAFMPAGCQALQQSGKKEGETKARMRVAFAGKRWGEPSVERQIAQAVVMVEL